MAIKKAKFNQVGTFWATMLTYFCSKEGQEHIDSVTIDSQKLTEAIDTKWKYQILNELAKFINNSCIVGEVNTVNFDCEPEPSDSGDSCVFRTGPIGYWDFDPQKIKAVNSLEKNGLWIDNKLWVDGPSVKDRKFTFEEQLEYGKEFFELIKNDTQIHFKSNLIDFLLKNQRSYKVKKFLEFFKEDWLYCLGDVFQSSPFSGCPEGRPYIKGMHHHHNGVWRADNYYLGQSDLLGGHIKFRALVGINEDDWFYKRGK